MKKKRTTFIILLVIAGLCLLGSIVSFTNVSKLNIKKTHTVVGPVKDAFITERIIRGIKYNRPQTVFCFRVVNSNQNFAINLSDGGYGDLERNIRTGDSIKVYYSPSSERFNMDVYQVETKAQVVYEFKTYKDKATNQAGYMLIGSIVILAIAFLGYTKFNIFKFLMRLTQVSQNTGESASAKQTNSI